MNLLGLPLGRTSAGRFGHWLRAEGKALSPYGKIFYGKQEIPPEDDEQVPETPIGEQQNATAPTEENYYPTLPLAIIPMAGKDTQKRGSNCRLTAFRDFIQRCSLMDLESKGCAFT